MMSEVTAHLERKVGTVLFDRPPVNVLSIAMLEAAQVAVDDLLSRGAEVLVIRTAGHRAFSAGVDVKDHVPARVPRMLAALHGLLEKLWDARAVSVCVVQGAARGGGAELALGCDLVVAGAEATFGFPEIQVGCFPPVAAALLPARLGPQVATDLVLTGRVLTADEAVRAELVNRLAEPGDLDAAVDRLISELIVRSSAVRGIALARLRAAWVPEARRLLREAEAAYTGPLLATRDVVEGISAFLEKRPPVWSGA